MTTVRNEEAVVPDTLPAAYAELGSLYQRLAELESENTRLQEEIARVRVQWRRLRARRTSRAVAVLGQARSGGRRTVLRVPLELWRVLRVPPEFPELAERAAGTEDDGELEAPPDPWAALAPAQDALAAQDLGSAARLAREVLVQRPADIDAARVLRDALAQAGALTQARDAARRVHQLGGGPADLVVEERLAGQVRALTPGWHPYLAWPAGDRPLHTRPRAVLHLVGAGGPPAGAELVRPMLRLERAGGLLPVVIRALDDARARGSGGAATSPAADLAQVAEVDGIPHERLSLGPFYPYDGPLDRVLEDEAWLVARLVELYRPALLRASWTPEDPWRAAVGRCVAGLFRVPWALDVLHGPGRDAAAPGPNTADVASAPVDELALGIRAAAAGALRDAPVVTVGDPETARSVTELGVPTARVRLRATNAAEAAREHAALTGSASMPVAPSPSGVRNGER